MPLSATIFTHSKLLPFRGVDANAPPIHRDIHPTRIPLDGHLRARISIRFALSDIVALAALGKDVRHFKIAPSRFLKVVSGQRTQSCLDIGISQWDVKLWQFLVLGRLLVSL